MKTTIKTYGNPSMGCYLDQSYRNSVAHDAATVRLAMGFGFVPDADGIKLLAREDYDVLSDERDDAQMMSEFADEAIEWLNEQETRSFMYWANNGETNAFGLWVNVDGAREDVGFVSGKKQDYPDADYRGEWLHVSDHGNATLYVREDRPGNAWQDVEVWSVV